MKDIKEHVKEILEDTAHTVKGLRGKGRKVVEKVGEKVVETGFKGHAALHEVVGDLSVAEVIEKFGGLKFTELLEKLRSSDVARHTDVVRAELLAALRLATAESVDKLTVAVEKLAKEVAGLKALKAEVKKLADEVKTLKARKTELPN
jgi:hypothetical protein